MENSSRCCRSTGPARYKFVGAKSARDISRQREPDPAVYLEAGRICEEISRKQAMREKLASRNVCESVDNSVTTVNIVVVLSRATLINTRRPASADRTAPTSEPNAG